MSDSLLYKLRSGKPPKVFFFFKGIFEAVHTRLLFQNPEKELFGTSGGAA